MKKLVFAVLAIGAMAACTKQNVQYEQTGELTLSPVVQKATKAAVADTEYPTTEKFNVWAWWGDVDATGTSTTLVDYTPFITNYLNAATFANRDNGNTWGGWKDDEKYPYYWPTTGSLVFAGYSPAEAKGTFTYGNNGLPTTEVFTATNFVQDKDITKTVDLMWFERTSKSYDQKTASSGVPVVFKHALSWLTFKFKLKDNNTPNNWKITKVELKGIENKGSFTSSNKSWGIASDATSNVVEVFRKDSGYDELTNTAVTLEGSSAIASGGSVLVIPQSCAYTNKTTNDASLVITYDLKNPAYTVGSSTIPEWITGQTRTLPLNGTNVGNAWDTWVTGKHYIYTITFGANEIRIAPEVGTWADPVTQDINVQ